MRNRWVYSGPDIDYGLEDRPERRLWIDNLNETLCFSQMCVEISFNAHFPRRGGEDLISRFPVDDVAPPIPIHHRLDRPCFKHVLLSIISMSTSAIPCKTVGPSSSKFPLGKAISTPTLIPTADVRTKILILTPMGNPTQECLP
mmetsp:Transcript_18664/g.22908  ORF Transcript_18664/g.22908 Transcript_18664/m.22908 type:complete len:144 (-) Transcript_18664:454-885(-)